MSERAMNRNVVREGRIPGVADLPALLAPWCEVSVGPDGTFVATDGRGADSPYMVAYLPDRAGPVLLRGVNGEPRYAIGTGWAAGYASQTARVSVYGAVPAREVAALVAVCEGCDVTVVTALPPSPVLRAALPDVTGPCASPDGDPVPRALAMASGTGLVVVPPRDPRPVIVPRARLRRVMHELADYGLPPPPVDRATGIAAFAHILATGRVPLRYAYPTSTREKAIEDLRRLLAETEGTRPRYTSMRRRSTRLVVPFSRIDELWDEIVGRAIATFRSVHDPEVFRDALAMVERPPHREGWTWVIESPRPIPLWASICEWERGWLTWPY